MNGIQAEIDDYLARYAATLTSYGARAAAGLWGVPGMILDDRGAGVVESREAMAEGLERSHPFYRRLGRRGPRGRPAVRNSLDTSWAA
ncbi:hypothetical protein [Streptomyces sp. AP-93]|uniref:hypothetical protein n=1 Tax=Streptomyces sp. AP-93 TaxID=2929048 RepID=UPI001FAEB104|nr:hypothetical protein [Streptomyces sp. AP-93]MCJ0873375.1 hypothetical protein [Streptomyces sp. AP-93]